MRTSRVFVIDLSKVSSSPLNPLNSKVRGYILDQLKYAVEASDVTSIVITGGSNFSAGADLTEFSLFDATSSLSSKNKSLLDVVDAIESCSKPVVAAIDGACLGGGLEVALACHYRVATERSSLGLPEVHVGVIPGAGGTQRLPRLVGLQQSLQMILTGQAVRGGNKALQMNLVDAVVDDNGQSNLLEVASKWALWGEALDPSLESRRLSKRPIKESPPVAHGILHVASLAIPSPERGGEGMHAALNAIRAAVNSSPSFQQGMSVESELFLQTLLSEQGNARRHSFFATRKCQKIIYPELVNVVKDHPLLRRDVSGVPVGVIGAGTMGGGIALVLLQTGYKVFFVDVNEAALKKGVDIIHQTIQSYVHRKRLSPAKAKHMLAADNFIATQNLEDLSECQLIVEAIIENMSIKQKIFASLDKITPCHCILLSNTSTLDIDLMATAVSDQRKQYFAGWHFFSPAHIMKLVEIVIGRTPACTSNQTVTLLQLLTKKIKKIGVVVGNCDGFCGNRMLKPYSAETVLLLVENKNSIKSVDDAFQQHFGFALGPFQMSDLAGNDIGYNVRIARGWVRSSTTDKNNVVEDSLTRKRPPRYTEIADDMVSQLGRLGQKIGKGWYDYDPAIGKGRIGLHSTDMEQFIMKYHTSTNAISSSISLHSPLSTNEIIERVLYPLVNEGFKILEEGIARTPADIDVVWLYGYGWPPYKGGPMYWADHIVGLPKLLQTLQNFQRWYPTTEHYVPSLLLKECVQLNVTVEEYYAKKLHTKKENISNKLQKSKL